MGVLVLGRGGQVARELARVLPRELAPRFAGRETLDLITADVEAFVHDLAPDAVVNAAAYTAVDHAEAEPEAAFRLNRDVPAALARACAARDIPFVHLSTDYVFDGEKGAPYVESDARRPLNVYGRSKAEGEIAVEEAGGRWTILRTSWLYSAFGSNFVRTMIRLASERDTVDVVADQRGAPTHARDMAQAVLRVLQHDLRGSATARGLFHVAGQGEATWADLAQAAFEESGRRGGVTAKVRRIATSDYPTAARRPADTRLASDRFAAAFGWRPGPWRESLALCFDDMESLAR